MVARAVATAVAGGGGGGGGRIQFTEAQWEARTEYDWDKVYEVYGVGTYE